MNVQLLLVLALAGPFCAFTHAMPTEIPEDLDVGIVAETVPEVTEATKVDFTIITGPPVIDPAVAAEEVPTEEVPAEVVPTEVVPAEVVPTEVLPAEVVPTEVLPAEVVPTEVVPAEEVPTEEVAEAEVVTEAAPPAITVNTAEVVVETEAAATAAPEPIITDLPVVETAAPTETAQVEVQPTGASKADVVIEDDPEEGLSSGQVVGIVIGALLAVVIVIAVVIAAPLKKKSVKQQERPKFWQRPNAHRPSLCPTGEPHNSLQLTFSPQTAWNNGVF
ncbi:hypothetical protein EYF80_002106 [Liparis tanakae]|uniref:Uncharacterized protein n=1 Tax=Liparis tanakae TaxID=230148 RepID=A0A4Z2JC12_9TELE|nr:hypothetical protein EYF80_002106 [Liparis tanakae]